MREHSETAWRIASLYSGALASETRDLAAHIDVALKAERAALQTTLARAKEKLALYRQSHGGEYIGGVEYTALIREIDAALA